MSGTSSLPAAPYLTSGGLAQQSSSITWHNRHVMWNTNDSSRSQRMSRTHQRVLHCQYSLRSPRIITPQQTFAYFSRRKGHLLQEFSPSAQALQGRQRCEVYSMERTPGSLAWTSIAADTMAVIVLLQGFRSDLTDTTRYTLQ